MSIKYIKKIMKNIFSVTNQDGSKVLTILGIKIKFKPKCIVFKRLNNKIIIIKENGEEKECYKIPGIKIEFRGKNNICKIKEPFYFVNSRFFINDSNNEIIIGAENRGSWAIELFGDNNSVKIGDKNCSCGVGITLINGKISIGDDCLFSNNIRIWVDGHTVIDINTNEILNLSTTPIIIKNHVWIGERATLTKKAEIPDCCIVGIASVVTKRFNKPNCVIAGNPAKIVKENITWDDLSPIEYQKRIKNL